MTDNIIESVQNTVIAEQFGLHDKLPTRYLPREQIVLPSSIIQIDLEKTPECQETPNQRLIQNILQISTIYNPEGKQLFPSSFRDISTGKLVPTVAAQPLINTDPCATSVIFQAEAPIMGLASSLLLTKLNTPQTHEEEIRDSSWDIVMQSLFTQYEIFDYNGERITIDKIESALDAFGFKHTLNSKAEVTNFDFQKEIDLYLKQFFTYSENGAQLKNLDTVKVKVGKAMRAITPYCFGNCPAGCLFCYVTQDGIRYPNDWKRPFDEVQYLLDQFNPETGYGLPPATRALMDWEPTNHPYFVEILQEVVKKDPEKQISIVTHGGHLTEELLDKIAADEILKDKVLFQVSLNSADTETRAKVMAGMNKMGKTFGYSVNDTAINSLELMRDRGIKFDVSIVAAEPWIPIEDVLNTIRYVDKVGGVHSYIRVALPTGTGRHRDEVKLTAERLTQIDDAVCALREEVNTPIVVTVGALNPKRQALNIILEGTMPDSAARNAGISHHHEIQSINGISPRSRTEASLLLIEYWNQYKKAKEKSQVNVNISIKDEAGNISEIDIARFQDGIEKNPRIPGGDKPIGVFGLLISDDVDFGIFQQMANYQQTHNFNNPVMVTGQAMAPLFINAIPKLTTHENVNNLEMFVADNHFFNTPPKTRKGEPVTNKTKQGNVNIAGLLTFSDIARTIDVRMKQTPRPDCIFIPESMLTTGGYDMTGRHINELAMYFGIPVIPIASRTGNI